MFEVIDKIIFFWVVFYHFFLCISFLGRRSVQSSAPHPLQAVYGEIYLPLQNICLRFQSPPPVIWLRISPVFSCDKTPNPNETKGLNVLGCLPSPPSSLPPSVPHYPYRILRLRSVSQITTRSFLCPNNYLTSPSQTASFVLKC